MRNIILIVLLVLFVCANVSLADGPELGIWRTADDYWGSTDKLGHALFYGWVAREMIDLTGNKWKGAGISLGIGIFVNEFKDAYVPWEEYGALGGDGFSWWDVGADVVGIGWAMWFPPTYQANNTGYCNRPIKELLPKVKTALTIGFAWTAGCAAYHYINEGELFPNGSGNWNEVKGKEGDFIHVLHNFNTEISFIGPWWLNAHLRPYLPLRWRIPAIYATLVGFEYFNGYLRERDVPFWGAKGFREGDIWVGSTSVSLLTLYEVIFYPKKAVCRPDVGYRLIPTRQGIGVQLYW